MMMMQHTNSVFKPHNVKLTLYRCKSWWHVPCKI